MSDRDVIINLRGLNYITLSDSQDQMYIGGGVINEEFVQAAYENGVQVCEYCYPAVKSSVSNEEQ